MANSKKMTVSKIAEMAGVSKATVSIVINDKEGVSVKTRERVLALMAENNVNMAVTKTKHDVVGVFYQDKDHALLSGSYGRDILAGFCEVVTKKSLKILLVPIEILPNNANKFRIFCAEYNIGAGLFFNIDANYSIVEDFAKIIPLVVIGTSNKGENISIKANNSVASEKLTDHVIENGHKKISFFSIWAFAQDHQERELGYINSMKKHSLDEHIDVIQFENYNEQLFFDKLKDKVLSENPPTCIVAVSDRLAIRLIDALTKLDIKIPEQISITGFDNSGYSEFTQPPLTTAKQPVIEMSRLAGKIIVDKLVHGENASNINNIFDCELVLRQSVAKLV